MQIHNNKTKNIIIIEKNLQSLALKFNFVVCSIAKAKDINEFFINDLQSSFHSWAKIELTRQEVASFTSFIKQLFFYLAKRWMKKKSTNNNNNKFSH